MTPGSVDDAKKAIRNKVAEIAKSLGNKFQGLKDDDMIPETGLLDSAGIMELIMWYETNWEMSIPQQDLTIENFGTINAMAEYLRQAGK